MAEVQGKGEVRNHVFGFRLVFMVGHLRRLGINVRVEMRVA